jgi:PAS domain S-box-containing protein
MTVHTDNSPGRSGPARPGRPGHRAVGSKLLAAIVDSSDDAILSMTLDGVITSWNQAAERIYGYQAAEITGRSVSLLMPPDRPHEMAETLDRIRAGERVDHYETTRRRKDGATIAISLTVSPIRDAAGGIVGTSSIAHVVGYELNSADYAGATLSTHDDVAEEGQQLKDTQLALLNVLEDLSDAQAQIQMLNAELEARVEQRTAELVAANKDLETFTYSVAHDLRSPLRALSGYGEALTEDYGDRLDETGHWYVERIQAATGRMGALIDDLLVLAEVSRTEMSLGPVDLSAEVAAIAGELQTSEPGRRIRFAIHDGVWANADRTLIRTVLRNLVGNAWKFTAKRDGAIIEFGATAAEDAGVCCYVRDNGAGFDPAFAGKLFQPFQRLHAVTEFPGTGIGLASVRRIIERHGGRVWAEGAVGRGATFYFTLDAKKAL